MLAACIVSTNFSSNFSLCWDGQQHPNSSCEWFTQSIHPSVSVSTLCQDRFPTLSSLFALLQHSPELLGSWLKLQLLLKEHDESCSWADDYGWGVGTLYTLQKDGVKSSEDFVELQSWAIDLDAGICSVPMLCLYGSPTSSVLILALHFF